MSHSSRDRGSQPQVNGNSKDPGAFTSQPLPLGASGAENTLPSFHSDANEGTLNPKLLNMQANPGPLPRSHITRSSQGSFKLPTSSSQPSLPALTTSTASSLDGPPHQNGTLPPTSQPMTSQPQPTQMSQSNGSQGQGGQGSLYPAMHLFPLNDTFIPKAVHLPSQLRIKIGRQTNNKSVPASNNGYFDSKVLSRTHAEVWFDADSPAGAGVFIKDVGSSNGTFINGERLSGEGMKSDVFQLRDGDVVEFGIDIASEDNKTILHHKVAAKVALALNVEDAERIAKSPVVSNSFAAVRRMSRAPGVSSSGMSFDHILQRLQSELQRSRETGQDLQNASMTLHKAHEAIHGNLPPPSMPSYPHTLPPIAPGPQNLSVVQNQLAETQASLTTHSDRVKSLEETITSLKEEVERTKTEMGLLLATKPHQNGPTTNGSRFNEDEDAQSDAVSIASTDTVRYMTEDDDRALRDEQDNLRAVNATLLTRIEELSGELRQANSISSTLSEQHKSQADLLSGMQERLTKLEDNTSSSSASASLDASEQRWNAWKSTFEASWASERALWQDEKAKLEAKILELETLTQQKPPSPRRRSKRRRDASGYSSVSDSSDAEGSAARASTPSSFNSGDQGPPGSEAGPSSPRKGERDATSVSDDIATDHKRPNPRMDHGPVQASFATSRSEDDRKGSPTVVAATTAGAVGVIAVAFVAWAVATGQAPKD